ncbi:hypothetical protein Y1Q_0023291 [Alligator mississippiensis]|uniref:Uncharacterized protein n=1 Tax=Alligator mississippiensis TaxID=8496 RepID=A0A151MJI1_ALLMI|nr:hypothetical protein Y1Q_0023291 [Alligator mississippiensis]
MIYLVWQLLSDRGLSESSQDRCLCFLGNPWSPRKTISSLPCCLSDLCLRRSKCCPPNLSKGGLKSRWPNLQNIQG